MDATLAVRPNIANRERNKVKFLDIAASRIVLFLSSPLSSLGKMLREKCFRCLLEYGSRLLSARVGSQNLSVPPPLVLACLMLSLMIALANVLN